MVLLAKRLGGPKVGTDEWVAEVVSSAKRITSIHDLRLLLRSTWDWNLFGKRGAKCFGSSIDITDVDMVVERNGYLLAMETKVPEAATLPRGQELLFQALLWSTPTTLLVIHGDAESKTVVKLEAWRQGASLNWPAKFLLNSSLDAWLGVCAQWFLWVNRMKRIQYRGPIWSLEQHVTCSRIDFENATPLEQERLKASW